MLYEVITATPENSARQRAYAAQGQRRMVYTPQMIFNGETHLEGARAPQVAETIDEVRPASAPHLRLTRRGSELSIHVPATGLEKSYNFV